MPYGASSAFHLPPSTEVWGGDTKSTKNALFPLDLWIIKRNHVGFDPCTVSVSWRWSLRCFCYVLNSSLSLTPRMIAATYLLTFIQHYVDQFHRHEVKSVEVGGLICFFLRVLYFLLCGFQTNSTSAHYMAIDRSLSHRSRMGNNNFYIFFFLLLSQLIHNVLMSRGSLLKQEALFMQKFAFFLTPQYFLFRLNTASGCGEKI